MLTPDQLRAFGDDGCLVIPGAVPPAAVAAARLAVDRFAAADPAGTVGPRFDFPPLADEPAFAALYAAPRVAAAIEALLGAGDVLPAGSVQLARTVPPLPRPLPGRPHIDGSTGEPGGAPHTFSLLAGIALTDQLTPADGGLWVWPGSHREHAAHFAEHGPEAFWAGDPGYPDVASAEPVQLVARPGDLILCHHLLGHCPGGVATRQRATTYLRVTSARHDWRASLLDWRHDFSGFPASQDQRYESAQTRRRRAS